MSEMMSEERLFDLFDEAAREKMFELAWIGKCHDCEKGIHVTATPVEAGIHIQGGAVYEPELKKFFFKCEGCYVKDSTLREYQDCEVYSRVVGYLRPVSQWNEGKQAEYGDREMFKVD